jgi:peptide/nickel transport system permease protein
MIRYLIGRLGFALLLVFVVSSGALLLTGIAPGDITSEHVGTGVSAAALAADRARLGLDRPILDQYAGWLSRAIRFDFGTSLMLAARWRRLSVSGRSTRRCSLSWRSSQRPRSGFR